MVTANIKRELKMRIKDILKTTPLLLLMLSSNAYSVTLGAGSTDNGDASSVAVGTNANSNTSSVSVGDNATSQNAAVAIGDTSISDNNGIAIGPNADAQGLNSIAIGNGSETGATTNSLALGANSVATENDTVSFGSVGNERRVMNVLDGTGNTDAATVGQLNAAVAASNNSSTDLINQFSTIDATVVRLDKKMRRSFASVSAISGLIQPSATGKFNISASTGYYDKQHAVAIGVGYRPTSNLAFRAGISNAGKHSTSGNFAGSIEW